MIWELREEDTWWYGIELQDAASFGKLPWGDDEFDVFLAVLSGRTACDITDRVLEELVKLNNDWIETLGADAECLHDRIDAASVAVGRQSAVGDGSPMTAWHEDVTSLADIAAYISDGGHGGCENKLVLVAGSSGDVRDLLNRLAEHRSTQVE